jgi:hypothetical protein
VNRVQPIIKIGLDGESLWRELSSLLKGALRVLHLLRYLIARGPVEGLSATAGKAQFRAPSTILSTEDRALTVSTALPSHYSVTLFIIASIMTEPCDKLL